MYFYESIIIVIGQSLRRLTFISAPKIPVCTTGICFLHSSTKYSYKGIAMSGLALSEKDITVICSNTEKKDIAKILTEVALIHESYAPLEIINHSDY